MTTFQSFLEKFSGSKSATTVSAAINKYYARLRVPKTSYPIGKIFETQRQLADYVLNVVKFASSEIEYMNGGKARGTIKVFKEGGWYYRSLDVPIPTENLEQGEIRKQTAFRISLNVRPDIELIKRLDNLLITSDRRREYIRNYKSPNEDNWGDWGWRHDPITIYMWKTSPKILQNIAEAAGPFVREGPEMIGEKIANGVYLDYEPTKERTNALFEKIKRRAPEIYDEINKEYGDETLSAGQYYAIRQFAKEFAENRGNIKMESDDKADIFKNGMNKLLRTAKVKNVVSRDGREYIYFIPKHDIGETAAQMKSMGIEIEEYKSGLYDKPILRLKKNAANKKIAGQISAMNIQSRGQN
ncbi:MAG: hypothetical protein LBD94_01540 [Rickettsiales bacterium]|jgi:hypothetical protein|nr:hypothetical protein [Rickettsiales bacterium]